MIVGHVAPYAAANWRAGSTGSSARTATTSRSAIARIGAVRERGGAAGSSAAGVSMSVTGRGSTADGQLPVHLRGMDRAFELVRAGRERRDRVVLRRRPREILVIDDLLAGGVEDVHVVRDLVVLVVEMDGEGLVRRARQRGHVELD